MIDSVMPAERPQAVQLVAHVPAWLVHSTAAPGADGRIGFHDNVPSREIAGGGVAKEQIFARATVGPMSTPEMPPCGHLPLSSEAPLAEHLVRNVEAITAMHRELERGLSAHQRAVERATGLLARPAALYVIVACVALWMIANAAGKALGWGTLDVWPLHLLQGLLGLAALLVATMVLITQNGQARASERHARLDLQLNLVTEQKVTKVLELLEELRRDLPNVRNRQDASVDLLVRPTETGNLLAALEQQAPHAVRDAVAEERAEERAAQRAAARDDGQA